MLARNFHLEFDDVVYFCRSCCQVNADRYLKSQIYDIIRTINTANDGQKKYAVCYQWMEVWMRLDSIHIIQSG